MNARVFASLLLLASGCANTRAESTTSAPSALPSPEDDVARSIAHASPASRSRASVALEASAHPTSMQEVALAPDGASALTLDDAGGVRLWTRFEADAVPWALPVEEPLWMSLAPTQSGFLAAFIDTAGATHVARIELGDEGARWVTGFDLPPSDPMFEIHVLPGGARILGLGVDHRVRLWDADGEVLAQLDEPGVIPWQLRVGHDAQGKSHAAVVQFAPVRIQRLEITDEALTLVGEPQTLAIDQSPNRNDIGMSAEGRYATAMQKPNPKHGRFEIEVVDLFTGTRRMLVADSDTRFRPRVHALADEVIAETGSGRALRLPLDAAVPWQPGADRSTLTPVAGQTISYDGSNEFSLMHATVRGGAHAIAWGDALKVSSVDGQSRAVVQHDAFAPLAVGMSPDGTTVAWGTSAQIVLESVDGTGAVRRLAAMDGTPRLLAFADDEHLVTMNDKGLVQLREIETDTVLDTASLPVVWGIEGTGWRPGDGGGHVLLASSRPSEPLQVLKVEAGKLGTPRAIAASERTAWPEGGKPRGWESADWLAGLGHEMDTLHLGPVEVIGTKPTPDAQRSVVVQKHRSDWSSTEVHLSLIDTQRNARVWVRKASGLHDTSWSHDRRRFAYADRNGGHVCDGATGESVLDRRWAPRVSPPNDAP